MEVDVTGPDTRREALEPIIRDLCNTADELLSLDYIQFAQACTRGARALRALLARAEAAERAAKVARECAEEASNAEGRARRRAQEAEAKRDAARQAAIGVLMMLPDETRIEAARDAASLGGWDRTLAEAHAAGFRAGAEAMREAAVALCASHQATCNEMAREPGLIASIRREYLAQARGAEDCADALAALPLPQPLAKEPPR
jgi:hypothetical protein